MHKIRIISISIKKYILPISFIFFTISLIVFSKQNLLAAKNGLVIWANSVVPSLLPFFIATELLSHTNVIELLGNGLNKVMRPIFNVPGQGAFALIMGILSGYPVGAKIVTKFRKENICTKEEGERLLAFTNNSGPLFIIGTVGTSLFGNAKIGFLLLLSHILSCISTGIVFRFWKRKSKSYSKNLNTNCSRNKQVRFSNLGEILGSSILNSINTVIMIGGFVVLFSVVISILQSTNILKITSYLIAPIFNLLKIDANYIVPVLTGIVELTNGVKEISILPQSFMSVMLCSALLGFGGISVFLQVFSITSKSDMSIRAYLLGKFIHAAFSCVFIWLLFKFI